MKQRARVAVDIGNSGMRAVVLPDRSDLPLPNPLRISWNRSATGSTGQIADVDNEGVQWSDRLETLFAGLGPMEWWISSVHPAALRKLTAFLAKRSDCQVEVVDFERVPVLVEVDYPDRLGIDRLLAAFAAGHVTSGRPLIVIQAGSAVTVDLLVGPGSASPKGDSDRFDRFDKYDRFLGGAILPGVPMMLRLLGSAAEMLPEVEARELVELPPLPGRNSQAAMLAGVSSCLVGGVQHLCARYRSQMAQSVPIVISGGDGPLLAPHLVEPVFEVNHLVLSGLRLLADSQRDSR